MTDPKVTKPSEQGTTEIATTAIKLQEALTPKRYTITVKGTERFYRAGRCWTKVPTTVVESELTTDQWALIRAESMLQVADIAPEPEALDAA
jgi:hypothetical protein